MNTRNIYQIAHFLHKLPELSIFCKNLLKLFKRVHWGNLEQVNINLVMLHIIQINMLTLTLCNFEQFLQLQQG